ncbi:MAG TPA: DUF222 domain-containing protein [Acidimicrobiales bacterium]|nr:DUF222 domain-containing protein [Acidimicrobiales bacterium]
MCVQLSELRKAVVAYSSTFDPAVVSCAQAAEAVREAAAIEHAAATIKALAAARAAEARTWKASGARSAEEDLARATGTSLAGARDALNLGRRLQDQPEVADAARRGELSPTQAATIAEAVAVNPAAGRDLVDAARAGGSLADLKNRCADVKAGAVDLEARRRDIHRRRFLRMWTGDDGAWRLSGFGNPEDGAQIAAALAGYADDAFHAARREGRREHPDAYRFDALVELARQTLTEQPEENDDAPPGSDPGRGDRVGGERVGGDPVGGDHLITDGAGPPDRVHAGGRRLPATSHSSDDRPAPAATPAASGPAPRGQGGKRPKGGRPARRGAPVKLLIRVDLPTLLRGFPTSGETCELVGYGPLSVSAVEKLVTDGDAFVAAILTKGRQVAGVVHLGRQPNAWQQTALQWLYPTCAAEGCPAPGEHLQTDHRLDWAATHLTLLDWLDRLCPHHHQLKTRDNCSLTDGVGRRPFVAPTDPRHPRHQQTIAGPP